MLNINLPYNPAIPRLGIYPREKKAYIQHKDFVNEYFVIADKYKLLNCASVGEWINYGRACHERPFRMNY